MLDQVNVVVRDMDASVAFYRRLGVEIADTEPQWERQHRSAVLPEGAALDLDATAFASRWDRGWPAGTSGAVLGFRVEQRATVDAIYADLVAHGAVGQQPPWDAFWVHATRWSEDPDGATRWGHERASIRTGARPGAGPDASGVQLGRRPVASSRPRLERRLLAHRPTRALAEPPAAARTGASGSTPAQTWATSSSGSVSSAPMARARSQVCTREVADRGTRAAPGRGSPRPGGR